MLSRKAVILDWETGYNHQQETRPQTLGVAMTDSPVGAAGWRQLEPFAGEKPGEAEALRSEMAFYG